LNYEKLKELFKIAEEEDIGVYFAKMSEGLKGYSTLTNGYYDIFINSKLSGNELLLAMAHEASHTQGNMIFEWMSDFQKELRERRAENSALEYIVPYEDVVKVVSDTYIRCEYEAAEFLHIDVDTFLKVIQYYSSKGLAVRHCDFNKDWMQWHYDI